MHLPLGDALAMIDSGEIADAKTVVGLLATGSDCSNATIGACSLPCVGTRSRGWLPCWTSSCLSSRILLWMSSERGPATRCRPTGATSARTVSGWRRGSADGESGHLIDFVGERQASGAATSSIARQLAAYRMAHRHLAVEQHRRDDPTVDLEGVRVPSGIPKTSRSRACWPASSATTRSTGVISPSSCCT